jgi:hypothetical protein
MTFTSHTSLRTSGLVKEMLISDQLFIRKETYFIPTRRESTSTNTLLIPLHHHPLQVQTTPILSLLLHNLHILPQL